MSIQPTLLRLLERILPLPTAPFHEHFISAFIRDECVALGLDSELDPYGNIIVRQGPQGEAPVAWVAHMDHPGFEIVSAGKGRAEALWFGGVDPEYFVGSGVAVYEKDSGSLRAKGRIEWVSTNPQGRVEEMTIKIDGTVNAGDFGTWDLVPYSRRGKIITTKGADDLVGCAIMLAALAEAKKSSLEVGVLGIFTRAEEVGFIGTLGIMESGILPPTTRIISIETSKALSGIRLGGGPVIRLGDRTSMFNHRMVLFMDYVARELQKKDEEFVYQRRVMDGGTCEATPFQLNGYAAGGLAIPLRNYHNQGRKGIMPEGIHLRDAEGGLLLLLDMLARAGETETPIEEIRHRWKKGWARFNGRLQNPG